MNHQTEHRQVVHRLANELYLRDLDSVARSEAIDWEQLEGRTIAISGATGMIGTFLVDVLMHRNQLRQLGSGPQADLNSDSAICVLALGRNQDKARTRLPYFDNSHFSFEVCDVSQTGARPARAADIIFHLASTTHPRAYATDPIGTITSNIQGLINLLDYACQKTDGTAREQPARFVFASSVEVYGQNRGDVDLFAEDYCGYIDSNTVRAGYPEAKRCGEALCQAYMVQKDVPVYIPRLPRTYGPTMLLTDSKALSQFIKKAVGGQNIVLKSQGNQLFSYLYVADVVSGLFFVLTHGTAGQAYNIADTRSNVSLKDLAAAIAQAAGQQVVFELPDAVEASGYSTATKAMLDASKLKNLGWKAQYDLSMGIQHTLQILSQDRTFVEGLL